MTETPIINAPVYPHGYVTGRYLTAVADGPDDDHLMDFTPAKGKVIFTPETVIRRHEGPSPALVVQRPVECPINNQGYLTSPDGWRGVYLIVGIYSVRFEVQGAQVPGPKRIEVKASHTLDAPLDLVLSMSEVVPPGSVVVVNETTAQRAEAAATRAEAVVTNLESEVRAVVLASPELKGKQGDKGDKGDPGAPGALANASSYILVGPGRPDRPATTNGVITGKEPVGAEYRSTDGAGEDLFDWMKRPTGWELAGGGSSTGGVYYDKAGKAVPYVYIVSDTDPGKSKVIGGQTYEVWWVQTNPPNPYARVPAAPSFNLSAKTYTIPSDEGAEYSVHGVAMSAGAYSVAPPATVNIVATPKSGYLFAQGAQTSWSQTYEESVVPYLAAASKIGVESLFYMSGGTLKNAGTLTSKPASLSPGATFGSGIGGFNQSITAGSIRMDSYLPTGTTAYTIATVAQSRTEAGMTAFRDWNNKQLAMTTNGVWRAQGPTGSANAATSAPKPSASTVYHIALTWDGATCIMYADGVEVVRYADAGPVTQAHVLLTEAGASATQATTSLLVDTKKALTAAQIKALSDSVVRA